MNDVWFKEWFNSPYYHKLYAHRDEQEAANFINNLINFLKPTLGSKMLDLGCGKGRHSMHLSNMGFDVTGIDLSSESICEALLLQNHFLHFYEHDMRIPFWINYFDVVFNFFTSFGYFNTQREHDQAIKNVVTSLKPGGTFVLDYLNVQFSTQNQVLDTSQQIGSSHYQITKWNDEHHFYKKIIVTDKNLSRPMQYTEKVAKFSLKNFIDMFGKQKLSIFKILGSYNLEDYNEQHSPRLIIIAKKP